jgi:hypothetical protein
LYSGTRIGSMIAWARSGDGSVEVNRVVSVEIVSDTDGIGDAEPSKGRKRLWRSGDMILRVRVLEVMSMRESVNAAARL